MNELLDWLRLQNGGVRTFAEFRHKALALRAVDPEHAALARLLGDLSGRFADTYEDQPLSIDVADHAFAQLTALVREAAELGAAEPAEQLRLLNEIGRSELT